MVGTAAILEDIEYSPTSSLSTSSRNVRPESERCRTQVRWHVYHYFNRGVKLLLHNDLWVCNRRLRGLHLQNGLILIDCEEELQSHFAPHGNEKN